MARFTLTDDLLVEAAMRTRRDQVEATRRRYLLYAAVSIATWAALRWGLGSDDVTLVALGALFAVFAALRPALVRRGLAATMRGRTDVGREVTVSAAGDAVRVDVHGQSESAVRLGALFGVEPGPDGVLVQFQPGHGLWIPAAGFATAADRDAFEQALLAGAPLPDPGL